MQQEDLEELVEDLDELLGVHGRFWGVTAAPATLETPDRMEQLMRDVLVELFGMEVRGL